MAGRHKLKVVLLGEGAWLPPALQCCGIRAARGATCETAHMPPHPARQLAAHTIATSRSCTHPRPTPDLPHLPVWLHWCVAAGRVGKTSIVLRFVRNEYDDRQVSTQEAAYLDKNITLGTQVRCAVTRGGATAARCAAWSLRPTGCHRAAVCEPCACAAPPELLTAAVSCVAPHTSRPPPECQAVHLGHSWAGALPCTGPSVLPRRERSAACVRHHRRRIVRAGAWSQRWAVVCRLCMADVAIRTARARLAWGLRDQVGRWVKELRKIVGPDISIVIAGNKSDLEKQRNVDHDEAVKCVLAAAVPAQAGAWACEDAVGGCRRQSPGVWALCRRQSPGAWALCGPAATAHASRGIRVQVR